MQVPRTPLPGTRGRVRCGSLPLWRVQVLQPLRLWAVASPASDDTAEAPPFVRGTAPDALSWVGVGRSAAPVAGVLALHRRGATLGPGHLAIGLPSTPQDGPAPGRHNVLTEHDQGNPAGGPGQGRRVAEVVGTAALALIHDLFAI